jgi:uncharacterized protein YjbI with pentapeptide repeats
MVAPPVQSPPVPDRAVKPIEDAGTLHSALMITFLLLCLYFGITVSSTTHRLLLLGGSLKLPLLDVSIPLEGFYFVAPAIILGVHIYLLLQYYVLVRRLRDPWTKLLGDDADFFLFPAVPVLRHVLRQDEPWVSRLIRLGLISINVVLPVLVLCLAQYYFLPYHSFWITLWHQIVIALDLSAAWYLLIIVPLRGHSLKLRLRNPRFLAMVGAVILVLFYSFVLATVPGTWMEFFTGEHYYRPFWFQRNLKLSDQLLISEAPSQEILAAFASKDPSSNSRESIYLQFAVGARLQGRDLRYADLEQAKLFNADFRGADLRDANLVGADLRGANLNPRGHSRQFQQPRGIQKREDIGNILARGDFEPTVLDSANLLGANFEGAKLILVSMAHADLQGARLAGLELTGADLSNAKLLGARLSGSELSYVNLDGALLRNTHLEGATLDHASLRGANLTRAEAPAASFVNANLEGTQLTQANLRTALFLGANLTGGDLRRAHLQGASGLQAERSDLRGAHLGGICGTQLGELLDVRSVDFSLPSLENWDEWRSQIKAQLKGQPRNEIDAVLARFDHGKRQLWNGQVETQMKGRPREEINAVFRRVVRQLATEEAIEAQATCIGTPLDTVAVNINNRLLYFEEQKTGVMENWLPLASQKRGKWDEAEFHRDLATDLLGRVCNRPGLARMLVSRAAGEYTPGDAAFDIELASQMLPMLQDLRECGGLRAVLDQFKEEHAIDLVRQIAWRVRKHEHSLKVQR